MPAAIEAARTTHTPEVLRTLARSGKDAAQNARLPMAASGLEGVGRAGWIAKRFATGCAATTRKVPRAFGIVRAAGRRVFSTTGG